MANILRLYLISVLLAVIAGHNLLLTEGRQLKETMQFKVHATASYDRKSAYEFGSSLDGDVNTFQPTTPGNSPGVGHSHAGLREAEETSPEANLNKVQPMVTGHSPGVGHSTKDAKVEPIS